MRLPLVREPAPTRGLVGSATRLYLRPIDLVTGPEAEAALAGGHGLALAGGPIVFRAVEVIARTDETIRAASIPVASLDSLAIPDLQERLTALTTPRRPVLPALERATGPILMGIVNVTPDSFSDGGDHPETAEAVAHGRSLADEGAAILDIGGESTRPGSDPVPIEEEIRRTAPVIRALVSDGHMVSIDSRNAPVMAAGLDAGASLVNDVSALSHDADAAPLLAARGCPVVLMHMAGRPKTMQDDPVYACAPLDVYDTLAERVALAEAAGIARARILIDPGFGFGKTVTHNLEITAWFALYHGLGCPILFGASRKSAIGALSRNETAKQRIPGSIALALAAVARGAQILRVHDVAATAQALAVQAALDAVA